MKCRTLAATIALIFSSAFDSHGAVYHVNNIVSGEGTFDVLFEDRSSDTPLSGGVVAIGYFPEDFDLSNPVSNIVSVVSNFTTVAQALAGAYSVTFEAFAPGYVDGPPVVQPTVTVGNPLLGRPLYVFVGNNATLAGSTAFALKQIDTIADDLPVVHTYDLTAMGEGPAPILGSMDTYTGDPASTGANSTFATLKLVPEPSAALLAGIGTAGLILARRR